MNLLFVLCAAIQEQDWKRENFAGPVPEEVLRSKEGHVELVRMLGSRRCKHVAWVGCIAFHPDGKRVFSAGMDAVVRIWEVPGGRALSASADGAVKLWSVADGKESASRKVGGMARTCFSSDGRRAVCADASSLRLWDLEKRADIDSVVAEGMPTALAASGDLVLIGNGDSTLSLYRLK
ncbi:MAG: WD40 repeat domain-containing protein [Planctomycetes bacterium]|nr:WD40 repeat domain-containing protein [Planctomycetota bacterium]